MIEGQVLLTQLKEIPEFKNAIIAGGYIRDNINNKKFKDIDIFLPVFRRGDYRDRILKIKDIPGLQQDPVPKEKYKGYHTFYTSDWVWNNIPVQIIGHRFKDENFAEDLLQTFNFNIDRCYYDGIDTVITPEAQKDMDSATITLNQLKDLSYLPTAMKKYDRLKEKYTNFIFKCDCLEITNKKQKEKIIKIRW